jgi:hypothetical protein
MSLEVRTFACIFAQFVEGLSVGNVLGKEMKENFI